MNFSFNALLLSASGTGMGTLMRGMLRGLSESPDAGAWTVYLRAGSGVRATLPVAPHIVYVELPGTRSLPGRLCAELFGVARHDARRGIAVSYSPTIFLPLTQRIPGVVTCVDFCCEAVPSAYALPKRLSRRLRFENSLFRAKGVGTISSAVARQLAARYGARLTQPVVVTACGVEDEYFLARDGAAPGVRSRYGLAERNVLSSGGTNARKDIRTLLRAFLALPDPLKAATRVIVMGPCDAQRLDALLAELPASWRDRVVFPGYIPHADKLALLSLADLFVFPTLDEGFGLPVLEAMAARLPVICSDLDVLREVGGETVRYFPPGDSAALAAAMVPALGGTRDAAALETARARARTFNWPSSAQALLGLLRTVGAAAGGSA
ncbi:MAG: glycosyltransferase family 4 protein [Planctomycetes bacterium]|nr:glycosyltransferase family 4 protein [Planctomycetota bacterium]